MQEKSSQINALREERPPALTAAERVELEAEAEVLIAEMKRLLMRQRRVPNSDDNGNMGVSHEEFLIGWDGVLLNCQRSPETA